MSCERELHALNLEKTESKRRKILFFDLETQRLAEEVGGWENKRLMRVSVAVLYDYERQAHRAYREENIGELLAELKSADLVIGFNIRRFDWEVLRAYSDVDFSAIPTLDILEEVKKVLGYRVSLDHLAKVTLDVRKIADGLQAVEWFRRGEMERLVEYCTHDVNITVQLFEYGRKNGYLLCEDKLRGLVRIPVRWAL